MDFTTEPALGSVADAEPATAAVLRADAWDFVADGSGRETTLDANRPALDRGFVVPGVLRDVSGCATGSTLLGRPVALSLATAPVAYLRLLHPDGKEATARAAAGGRVPLVAGPLGSVPIERITAAGGTVWFHLYWPRDTAAVLDPGAPRRGGGLPGRDGAR